MIPRMPPIAEPKRIPTRSGRSARRAPASSTASCAAASASSTFRSSRRASFGGTTRASSKSLTSAAMRTGKPLASKARMKSMPLRPATADSHVDGASLPTGRDRSHARDDDAAHRAKLSWTTCKCRRARPDRPVPADGGGARPRAPRGRGWQYEPKWDGFRGVLENDGGELALWSRNGAAAAALLPGAAPARRAAPAPLGARRRDRDRARRRRSTSTRCRRGSIRRRAASASSPRRSPREFIAFDVLLWKGKPVHELPLKSGAHGAREASRRASRSRPRRRDLGAARLARDASRRPASTASSRSGSTQPYLPGSREAVVKVKPHKTADCVVVGVRWKAKPDRIATLLLGLYATTASSTTSARRRSPPRGTPRSPSSSLPLLDETSDRRFSEPNRWGTGELEESPLAEARGRGALRQGAGPPLPPRDALPPLPATDKDPADVHLARGAPAAEARTTRPFESLLAYAAEPWPTCAFFARDGCTRVGSPGIFGKCGGYGASPTPSASSRSTHSSSTRRSQTASSIAGLDVAELREALRHRREREVLGLDVGQLVPRDGRRDGRVGPRAHRVGRGDRPVARVLVVVDEDALAPAPPSTRRSSRASARAARPRGRTRARSGARRGTSQFGSIRQAMWMPRLPDVFGQPMKPISVEHLADDRRHLLPLARSRARAADRCRCAARPGCSTCRAGARARDGSRSSRGSPPTRPAPPRSRTARRRAGPRGR